jgi:hypothetical protein
MERLTTERSEHPLVNRRYYVLPDALDELAGWLS